MKPEKCSCSVCRPRRGGAKAEKCSCSVCRPGCAAGGSCTSSASSRGCGCLVRAHIPPEPDAPPCRDHPCCKHGGKKRHPPAPVVIRLRSQEGESRQIRLDPPTFLELERVVWAKYKVLDPHLYHKDEAGYVYPIRNQEDFDHAIRVTGSKKYLTVIIGRWIDKPGKPCCCCGEVPPGKKRPKPKPLDVIHHYNDAPPGLRAYLRNAPPGKEWLHWNEYQKFKHDIENGKPKRSKRPMLRAFLPDCC